LLEKLGFSFEETRTVFPDAPPLKLFAASLRKR